MWTVTSADAAESYNSETYASVTIGRDEFETKGELSKASLEITVGLDDGMGKRWLRTFIDQLVTLTIFSKVADEVSVAWKGRLTSINPVGAELKLVFESIFTSLRRPGLRKRYQRSCPHTLYGRGCNLNKEDFSVNGHITFASNEIVIVPEAGDYENGYFRGGIIEGPDGSFRFITDHDNLTLTLIRTSESIVENFLVSGYGGSYGMFYGGLSCRIFPGCSREIIVCKNRFDNISNYGGFPFIPLRNPFDGSSII